MWPFEIPLFRLTAFEQEEDRLSDQFVGLGGGRARAVKSG
jgi:hypothetical protein